MDDEDWKVIAAVAEEIRDGKDRNTIVERLIEAGYPPQAAQNVHEFSHRYAAGQGFLGYDPWFRAILMGKAEQPAGKWALMGVSLVCLMAMLPISFWLVDKLPSGNYPAIALAVPGLLVGFLLCYLAGHAVFNAVTSKQSAKNALPPAG